MSNKPYTHDFVHLPQPKELGPYYWADSAKVSHAFTKDLSPRSADLLDVATAVYAVDRRTVRARASFTDTGRRHFRILMPVRELAVWVRPEVRSRLSELLSWLSEDEWSIDFAQQAGDQGPTGRPGYLFPSLPQRPSVSLFSGGLDSLAGLITRTQQDPNHTFVLVSGRTNPRLEHQQRIQAQAVESAFRAARWEGNSSPGIFHIVVPFGTNGINGVREEKTQRTRAFVFLALGAIAAVQAGADTLSVYENGVGALNLPLNDGQLGVDNYRGVHPRSLLMMADLVELVLERPIRIRNPFLFSTKAEMCSSLRDPGLSGLVWDTVSCDGFAQRVPGQAQCGVCTSCLLRRSSIHAAGLASFDATSGYRHDVLHKGCRLSPARAYPLRAMQNQVERLRRCLNSAEPWATLTMAFPELVRVQLALTEREGMRRDEIVDGFIHLYRTYVQEWQAFPVNPTLVAA